MPISSTDTTTTATLRNCSLTFSYHYNAQDRLVKVEEVNGSTIAEYAYDPFGRRLWKDVGGTRTYFFYADEGLVAEYDAAGNEMKSYGYNPGSTWSTDPLWLKQGTEFYFYQNDHLGTPQKLVKQNGAVVWYASYMAFGQARIEVETVTNNLRFPGQYFDAETGLHYNWYRYYTSGVGRYLRVDPIGLDGGINVFWYVRNNPVILTDPWGLRYISQPPGSPQEVSSFEQCREWIKRELQDMDWCRTDCEGQSECIPACPCSRPSLGGDWTNEDPGRTRVIFHPGAASCIRSRTINGHAQQCCYDRKNRLITHGAGAGTPDKVAAPPGLLQMFTSSGPTHQEVDVNPWDTCRGWFLYNEVRPPDNSNNCPPNPVNFWAPSLIL